MGTSTDAIVGWGIAFSDESECDDEAMDAAMKRLKIEGVDVKISWHCYIDSPMLFVVIADTYRRAWRGDPKKCDDLFSMAVDEDLRTRWTLAIRRAVDVYIEELAKVAGSDESDPEDLTIKPDALGWYLFSSWS